MFILYTITLGYREWQTTERVEAFYFMHSFGIDGFKVNRTFTDKEIKGIANTYPC